MELRQQPAADHAYWERRGQTTFTYRGDRYYTVTPIGHYVRRRRSLLDELERLLRELPPGAWVHDFGCGDGFYAVELARRFPALRFVGCDRSASMIEVAAARAQRERIAVRFGSCAEMLSGAAAHVVLIVSVLAHITDDEVLSSTLASIRDHLVPAGCAIVFEMTASPPVHGPTWRRRTADSYRGRFESSGLSVMSSRTLRFPFHDVVGSRVCRAATRLLYRGDPLRANASPVYQRLSAALAWLSPVGDRLLRTRRAYTLFVLRRAL